VECLHDASRFSCKESKLLAMKLTVYAKALIQDSESEAQNWCRSCISKKGDGFLEGCVDNNVLLCYPFGVDISKLEMTKLETTKLETTVHDLKEVGGANIALMDANQDVKPHKPAQNDAKNDPGTLTAFIAGAITVDPQFQYSTHQNKKLFL